MNYVFQEYPRMIYRDGEERIVNNKDEFEVCKAEGWSEFPGSVDTPTPEIPHIGVESEKKSRRKKVTD